MKLRLPNKLQAALVAALASVSLTTLSSGTIAVATGAALLAGQQAMAEVIQAHETLKTVRALSDYTGEAFELTSLSLTTSKTEGTAPTGGDFVSPKVNVGNGGTWTLTFTLTNTSGQDITLTSLGLDVIMYNNGGSAQTGTTSRALALTLKEGDKALGSWDGVLKTGGTLTTPATVLNSTGSPVITLTQGLAIANNSSVTLTLNAARGTTTGYLDGCFHGLQDMVVNYSYQASENVWLGTGSQTWGDAGAWSGGVPTASTAAVFNETGTSTTVNIDSEAAAAVVSVSGKAYTFNITGSGSLAASALEVTGNQLTIQGGSVTAGTLTVGDAAGVSLSGSGSLAVTGGVTLGEGAGITVGTDATLKVADAATAKALMMGTQVTNSGIFEIASNVTLDNAATTRMTGILKVDSGVTLKLSQSKDNPTSIASFSGVILAGGELWSNTAMQTVNNVTAIENSRISFADYPNSYQNYLTTFAGQTNIEAEKTLTIYTEFKSNLKISNLTGAGTLSLTTANRDDNGEFMAIDSLKGFTGNISLAPGNANNPVRVTAALGDADVSMGTLILNNNSGAASANKHTFYKLTGEHNLTMTGIDGTNGEVSLTVPTLTLNTDSNHSYTGSLSISGQLVKTGAGTQTLGSFAINETILVQGGTLTLNGTYTLDGLADDAGRTYTFQDENGDEADEEVGGFRITNGTKTVYTETSGTVSRAEGTKFQLDGKDVEVDANGVYKFPTSADKTTLWVNGSTPLSYDTYYAASGEETKALTTAQVADGATLVIGTNAVGTLAFQENGTTINLDGSGTVNAISGTGTLNLNGTVTLGSALTVGDGETFATSGTGTLNAGTLNANGGTATFDSAASISRLIVNGSAAATVGGSGAIAVNSTTQDQGVEIALNKSLTLVTANMNVAGTIHNNGSLTVGDGTTPTLVKTRYFVNGNNNGGTSSFNINANATLVATGADSDNTHASGWVMGEWNNTTTGTVAGTLLAQNASIWGCDSTYTLNIENGGLVATKGVRAKKDNQAYTVNLKDGGTLVLGGTSTPGATVLNATAGSTIGTYAASGVDYSGGIATTAVEGKAVTLDTSLYTFSQDGTVIAKGDTAGALTISGAITGTAALAKVGAGTLTLTGANTYSGGTTVEAGTLQASSLGTGDITVNGGTLELTSSISTQGNLSITGGTLAFAGADMLTAGSLAVSGTVTFDLTNVAATKAGTIILATATGDATGDFSGVTVNWALPESFSHGAVYVKDHSWVIDLISTGQALTWAGGTGNWSYDEADTSWLTPGDEPTRTHFTDKDSAVFTAAVDPALANIKEAISTAGVEVQAGADVTLQAAIGAETASLTPIELDIAGRLSTSVDVAATVVEATGADASWNITGGTVTADSITVAQDGKLALSGTGMTAETVSGPGTVVVGDGFTLTLGRQIDSDQATDLAILNNGTVAVALGSSQNVINMDAASTGTLVVTAGTISNQSALGANQTLQLNGGTIFAVKGGETAFASDIALAGDVSMQLKDSANATIAGAVSGSGKTLSVSGGAGNQNLSFTGEVNLGAFTTDSNAGGTIAFSGVSVSIGSVTTNGSATVVFNGGSATIGAIATKQGSTIQFSNKEGAESSSYSFDTFELGGNNASAARWLVVDANVTVEGKKDTLTKGAVRATISNDWGIDGGGVKVDGILNLAGEISMDGPESNYIKGAGIINTTGLNLCNGSTTYIQDGITVNITTSAGIHRRNNNANLHFANATLAAVNDEEGAGADWTLQSDYSHVYLDDSTNGTTFKAASNRTITLASAMEGTGKLVKAGEGIVKLTGANTYSGGTTVNAGTLLAQNASALGSGVVNITGGNLVIDAVMNDYSANEFHNTGGTLTMNNGSKLTMFATGGTRTYDLGNVVVNGSAGIVTKVNGSCYNAQLNMTSLVSAADGAEIVLASGAQYTKATVFSLNTNQTDAYNGTITVMESQTNSGARPIALNVALGADAAEADVLKGAVIVLDNANNDGNLVGLGLGSDVTVKGIDSGNTATNGTHVIFAGAATTSNDSFSSSGEARTLTVDTAGTDHATRAKVLDKVNLVKQGAGTQTFSGDMSSFNGSVSAEGGTLNVLNAESLAVQNVHIGEGAVFGVYSGDTATASTRTEGSIAITENNVLSALENATLNANLVMEAGSTLDVSYAQGSNGLIMGSSVTLKEGVLLQDSLHQQQYPDINDFLFEYLSDNDYYYLYDSVEELYIQQGGTTQQVYELNFTDWRHFDMDASSVFTNLSENTYALVYSWDGSNVGSVALVMIPEPTTGTLSLLALCALAARRRRK